MTEADKFMVGEAVMPPHPPGEIGLVSNTTRNEFEFPIPLHYDNARFPILKTNRIEFFTYIGKEKRA